MAYYYSTFGNKSNCSFTKLSVIIFMNKIKNPKVLEVINSYPKNMLEKVLSLRQLILDIASETKEVTTLEETLKWGESSYITNSGSTIRLGWKKSKPNQHAIYFNCKTKLVDTFKVLYSDIFNFEGNRAIIFDEDDKIPLDELKHCISISLTYKLRKNLPMLGA